MRHPYPHQRMVQTSCQRCQAYRCQQQDPRPIRQTRSDAFKTLSTLLLMYPLQAVVWHNAANAGSLLCRQMCAVLWNHRAEEYGISFAGLRDFVHANLLWRDNYLSRLGVPSKFPDTWDFLAAITAASSDA